MVQQVFLSLNIAYDLIHNYFGALYCQKVHKNEPPHLSPLNNHCELLFPFPFPLLYVLLLNTFRDPDRSIVPLNKQMCKQYMNKQTKRKQASYRSRNKCVNNKQRVN